MLYVGIVFLVLGLISIGIFTYRYLYEIVLKKPQNTPNDFLSSLENSKSQKSAKKCFVLAGDSLTCGNMSESYVEILKNDIGVDFELVNAGINADLAYSLLQRTDEIVACKPDFITILIGTNDCNATLSENLRANYVQLKKIPESIFPNLVFYTENLTKIVRKFKEKTNAQIALISMPVLAEKLNGKTFQEIQKYANAIKKIAQTEQVAYLPVFESHIEFLENQTYKTQKEYNPKHKLIELAMFRHYILRQSWDKISKAHGFNTTPDFLHINSDVAKIIAEIVKKWLKSNSKNEL